MQTNSPSWKLQLSVHMPVESSMKSILVFVCVSIIVNCSSYKDLKCPWDWTYTWAEHIVTASRCITCSEGSLFVGEHFALFGLSVSLY